MLCVLRSRVCSLFGGWVGGGRVQAAVFPGKRCSLGLCREINCTILTQLAENANPEGN